jgi:lipopolysaccharide heptosyltransferase II
LASPKRILIRLPNWLGDVLMARPFLHALAQVHGGAERRGVGPAPLLELLDADRVLDPRDPWPTEDQGARRQLVDRVRAWHPDLAFVLPPSFSSAWFAWRTRAPERVGFAHEGRSVLLTRALRRGERGERHLSEEYLSLLGAERASLPPLRLGPSAEAGASALVSDLGLENARLALVAPSALYGPAKRWPEARFVELSLRLAREGFTVLVCGTSSERALCEAVARGAGARSVAGRTDLATQAGLCSRSSLAVSNDSGVAHLAAAVGAPTVAIFGSTSSAWTAPLGPRVRVVQQAPVCSPCFQRTCRIGYRCLTAVSVEDVWAACREIAA